MQPPLSLPKPRDQNWSTSSPQQSRFCYPPSTEVFVFSIISLKEILLLIEKIRIETHGGLNKKELIQLKLTIVVKKLFYILVLSLFSLIGSDALAKASDSNVKSTNPMRPEVVWQDNGGIDGKITDKSGYPIAFVVVQAINNGKIINSTKSDINGNYKIKPLPPGLYTIKYHHKDSVLILKNIEVLEGSMHTRNAIIYKKSRLVQVKKIKLSEKIIDQKQFDKAKRMDGIFRGPYHWTEMIIRYNNFLR